jgi:hypothetical protein
VHTAAGPNLVTLSTSIANSAGDHKLVAFAEQKRRTAERLPGGPQSGQPIGQLLSFACDPGGEIKGVPVATCHCPIGESLDGTAVEPSSAFGTQAGQGNTQICFDHPVGAPLPSPP